MAYPNDQNSSPAGIPVWGALGAPLGYQQITAPAASTALTVPAGAKLALISVSTQAVRFRDDGTAPTASIGFPLPVTGTGSFFVYSGSLAAFQVIQQASGAVLDILYYG